MTERELLALVAALGSKGLSPQQSVQKAQQIVHAVDESLKKPDDGEGLPF
jgi:hypothetical protein